MGETYEFGECVVDVERYLVRRGGDDVHVEPQVFDVIVHLLRHRGQVVSKNDLLDAVWGDRFVSESALATRINAARRALGDDGNRQAIIRTAFGRGYEFIAELTSAPSAPSAPGASSVSRPLLADPIGQGPVRRVAVSGGDRLAYTVSGDGPPLLKAANWMTHIEFDRTSTVWRHWIEGLGAGRSLIRYDERGCGLSDWDTDDFSFDTWVDDLRMVADDAGLERFPLIGISQGAAVAISFAARHPERVSGLILVGAYPRGRLVRAQTDEEFRAAALDLELARIGWGVEDSSFMQVFASQFIPDGDRDQWLEFTTLQARTTSADNAVRFLETFAHIDVTGDAPNVQCPTLVIHSKGELRVPADNARELAELIPGTEMVSLPSRNHILQADEPAWPVFLDAVDRFLGRPDIAG